MIKTTRKADALRTHLMGRDNQMSPIVKGAALASEPVATPNLIRMLRLSQVVEKTGLGPSLRRRGWLYDPLRVKYS
jgi:hypothetical protein